MDLSSRCVIYAVIDTGDNFIVNVYEFSSNLMIPLYRHIII